MTAQCRPRRGRPRDFLALLRRHGNGQTEQGERLDDAVCQALWQAAATGTIPAIRLLLAYLLGGPAQRPWETAQAAKPMHLTGDDFRHLQQELDAWRQQDAAGPEAQEQGACPGPEPTRP